MGAYFYHMTRSPEVGDLLLNSLMISKLFGNFFFKDFFNLFLEVGEAEGEGERAFPADSPLRAEHDAGLDLMTQRS